jgi:rod shape-determining protein MreC
VGKEDENRRLRYRIFQYEQQINSYDEMIRENERLKQIVKLKAERRDYVATAKVFARDPTNWFQMFWINKGSDEGLLQDMVVTGPSGPVGRIHRVLDNASSVMLITDVNSAVAARLQTSRVEGILEGRGKNRCFLKYVSKDIDVKVGERVITSGLDGIFPTGFLIGTVSRVEKEGEEVFQLVEVEPSQDMNTVEEVVILKK